jgi:hypothetical protein
VAPTRDTSLIAPLRPEPWTGASLHGGLVWYVAYGSNMRGARLSYYLAGGQPPGGSKTFPGCRDRREPERSIPVELRGKVYFALESAVWTGGRAFYDPDAEGTAWARGHLVTIGQFSDILAQEMYRVPAEDLALADWLAPGREQVAPGRTQVGPGRYETVVCVGSLDGYPALTFTAPWSIEEVACTKPSAAYLENIAAGLLEAGAWNSNDIAAYLVNCAGAAGSWGEHEIAALIET